MVMAVAPWTSIAYGIGVLVYAVFVGAGYAAFSALVVHAIGRGVASTKYAILQSLGNIPVAYMVAFNGWVHDRYGGVWMLKGEALVAIVCIAGGLFVLQKINAAPVPRLNENSLLP
jgi:PAT family beta-lactamase induction signal transducer AmpG